MATAPRSSDDDTKKAAVAIEISAVNHKESPPPISSTMNEWFQNTSPEECEAMTAIQLDYRFEAEDFRTEWWVHAEHLGFTKVDYYHYKLPPAFGRYCRENSFREGAKSIQFQDNLIHNAQTICMKLNSLSIPQGRSVFDRIGDANTNTSLGTLENAVCFNRIRNVAFRKDDIVDLWTTIREELIFRKFHIEITEDCRNRVHNNKKGNKNIGQKRKAQPIKRKEESSTLSIGQSLSASTVQKRKLWSSADAGAELFFRRGKKGKGNLPAKGLKGSKGIHSVPKTENSISHYLTTAKAYEECANSHQLNEVASIREKYLIETFFEEWKFLISTNHSLLFYGVGSKKKLLNQFSEHDLEGDVLKVVEVDGFDKNLTVDGILQLLIDQWLAGKEHTIRKKHLFHVHFEKSNKINRINTSERISPFFPRRGDFYVVQRAASVAKRIAKQVARTSRPITLIIHNIDGAGLCNDIAHEVLAVLVSRSRTDCGLNAIRLVASVDHINSQIFAESNSRHSLQWLFKEVHTHRPYVSEVLNEQAISENHVTHKSITAAEARDYRVENDLTEEDHLLLEQESIFSVLVSLASTHAESLRQLAWLQLKSDQEWVTYTDLLKRCRSARIVQADQQLRLYLRELLDHNILERDKDVSSTSSYRIPYSDEILNLIWNFGSDR